MRNIVLIRHGKSSWKYQDLEDFERPLNERGREDSRRMSGYYPEHLPAPDLILCSSAERALQTVRGLIAGWSFPLKEYSELDELYLADAEDILLAVRSYACGSTVYLCGHNPGISEFASRLCDMDLGDLPTFATVHIEISGLGEDRVHSWENLNWADGELKAIFSPKTLPD